MNFDEIKDKAKGAAEQHGDKADGAVDGVSDTAKDRFGHDEQVDSATDRAKGFLGGDDTENR